MKDFFVSFNSKDRAWAAWIAWELENAGYSVVFQDWDYGAGSDFVLEMQKAAKETERTVAVISPSYLLAILDDQQSRTVEEIRKKIDALKPGSFASLRSAAESAAIDDGIRTDVSSLHLEEDG